MVSKWYLMELMMEDALLDDVPDLETAELTFYKIKAGEAIWGTFWVRNDVVKIHPYTPPAPNPDPVPVPDPNPTHPPVAWVCLIEKVNRRKLPDSTSQDVGDVFKNGTVSIVQELPIGTDTIWGKTDIGDYVALKFKGADYFKKTSG